MTDEKLTKMLELMTLEDNKSDNNNSNNNNNNNNDKNNESVMHVENNQSEKQIENKRNENMETTMQITNSNDSMQNSTSDSESDSDESSSDSSDSDDLTMLSQAQQERLFAIRKRHGYKRKKQHRKDENQPRKKHKKHTKKQQQKGGNNNSSNNGIFPKQIVTHSNLNEKFEELRKMYDEKLLKMAYLNESEKLNWQKDHYEWYQSNHTKYLGLLNRLQDCQCEIRLLRGIISNHTANFYNILCTVGNKKNDCGVIIEKDDGIENERMKKQKQKQKQKNNKRQKDRENDGVVTVDERHEMSEEIHGNENENENENANENENKDENDNDNDKDRDHGNEKLNGIKKKPRNEKGESTNSGMHVCL